MLRRNARGLGLSTDTTRETTFRGTVLTGARAAGNRTDVSARPASRYFGVLDSSIPTSIFSLYKILKTVLVTCTPTLLTLFSSLQTCAVRVLGFAFRLLERRLAYPEASTNSSNLPATFLPRVHRWSRLTGGSLPRRINPLRPADSVHFDPSVASSATMMNAPARRGMWNPLYVYWMYPECISVRYTFSIRNRRLHRSTLDAVTASCSRCPPLIVNLA